MKVSELLSTEELCRKWPVDGPDPIKRWWTMLAKWREAEPPRLVRHHNYELIYRCGFAVYVYSEPRVLHLIWDTYEHSPHPLCTQIMMTHGPAIKQIVCEALGAGRK
jgi:hypothetical protein